jgi:hypothetical protein
LWVLFRFVVFFPPTTRRHVVASMLAPRARENRLQAGARP